MPYQGILVNKAYSINKYGTVVYYFIRTKKGRKTAKLRYHKPFFYAKIKKGAIVSHPDITSISKENYYTQFGTKVKRIYVKIPKSISGYKKKNWNLGIIEDIPGVGAVDENKIPVMPCFEKVYENNIEYPDRCTLEDNIKYGIEVDTLEIVDPSQVRPIESDLTQHIITIDTEVRTYLYDPRDKIEKPYVDFPNYIDPTNSVLSIQCLDNQIESVYVMRISREYINWKGPNEEKKGEKYHKKYSKKHKIPFHLEEKIKKLVKGLDEFDLYEHVFYDECSMFNFWIDFIVQKDYDTLCAFNGMDFDFPYMFARMTRLKINFNRLSPLGYTTVQLKGTFTDRGYVNETNIRIPGRNLIDTMDLFKLKLREKRAKNSLNSFAWDFLKVQKVVHDLIEGSKYKRHSIDYEFFEQPYKFLLYGAHDTIIDFYLQRRMGIWKFYFGLMKSCGVQLKDIIKSRKRVRQESLFYAKKFNMILEPEDYDGKKFDGATVVTPSSIGKMKMAADLDVKSMYPSIIEAYNISWDTLILDHKIITNKKYKDCMDITEAIEQKIPYCSIPLKGIYFRLDKIGLIPQMIIDNGVGRDKLRKDISIITEIYEHKKGLKPSKMTEEQMDSELIRIIGKSDLEFFLMLTYIEDGDVLQYILKVKNNSIYGNLPKFLAKCVTACGREMMKFTRIVGEKCGFPADYSDTDSIIYRTFKKTVKESLKVSLKLADKINELYEKIFAKKFNCKPEPLKIKSEELYNPIIFVANKSKPGQPASKKYVKRLVGFMGKELPEDRIKIEHKGIIKPRECSPFDYKLGELLIESTGSNDSKIETIDKIKNFITDMKKNTSYKEKIVDESGKSKTITVFHNLEYISFPKTLGQNIDDYRKPAKNTPYKERRLDKNVQAIENTNLYAYTWTSNFKPLGKKDTAFLIMIFKNSIPKDVPVKHHLWALDLDDRIHPKFKIDYNSIIKRSLTKYEPLLVAVDISIPEIISNTNNLW